MNDCLAQYYRCPEKYLRLAQKGPLPANAGYFQFGEGAICYGSYVGREPAAYPSGTVLNALQDVEIKDGTTYLPFDPSQVVENLRREMYTVDWQQTMPASALARMYYLLRPFLPGHARKYLQAFYFRGWSELTFPRWPVDCSVDNVLAQLLLLSLKTTDTKRIPFIWFWPESAASCAIMTHDVETEFGRTRCQTLMDIDDSFGIKASFQVIPEQRYSVSPEFLSSIRDRGFEVTVHDLNHDGRLYMNRGQFLDRAAKINAYAVEYGTEGFRAGCLYRKQSWYDALKVSYDMSVPNVAHLDPQRGGCCTVMPYFIGEILELPVTTTQDYTLFAILHDYSIELWKQQMQLIMQKHGLMSFIVHPDYLVTSQQRGVYEALLGHLTRSEKESSIWMTTPGEVNRWWRQRAAMKLVNNVEGWQIQGAGAERARLAYAVLDGDRLVYEIDNVPVSHGAPQ